MRSPIKLLTDSISIFKNNFSVFAKVWLVLLAVSLSFSVFSATLGDTFSLVASFITGVVGIFYSIASIKVIIENGNTNAKEAYVFAKENFLSYLWVSIIAVVIIVVGLILVIIPGIVAIVFTVFSIFIVLTEKKYGFEALKTSREYVRGKWWAVFGRLLFLLLLAIIVSAVSDTIFGINESNYNQPLMVFLSQAITLFGTPISTAYMYFMYSDIKNQAIAPSPIQATPEVTE